MEPKTKDGHQESSRIHVDPRDKRPTKQDLISDIKTFSQSAKRDR